MNIEWKSSGHTSALVVCDSVKVFQKELRNHSSKGNKDKSTLFNSYIAVQCIIYTVVLLCCIIIILAKIMIVRFPFYIINYACKVQKFMPIHAHLHAHLRTLPCALWNCTCHAHFVLRMASAVHFAMRTCHVHFAMCTLPCALWNCTCSVFMAVSQ